MGFCKGSIPTQIAKKEENEWAAPLVLTNCFEWAGTPRSHKISCFSGRDPTRSHEISRFEWARPPRSHEISRFSGRHPLVLTKIPFRVGRIPRSHEISRFSGQRPTRSLKNTVSSGPVHALSHHHLRSTAQLLKNGYFNGRAADFCRRKSETE